MRRERIIVPIVFMITAIILGLWAVDFNTVTVVAAAIVVGLVVGVAMALLPSEKHIEEG